MSAASTIQKGWKNVPCQQKSRKIERLRKGQSMGRVLWDGLWRRDDERKAPRLLTVDMDLVDMALGRGGSGRILCVCVCACCVSVRPLAGLEHWAVRRTD